MPKVERILVPPALVSATLAAVMYVSLPYIALLAFMFTLGLFLWRGYDSRLLISVALLLFTVGLLLLSRWGGGRVDLANEVAVKGYYFLAIGVLAQLFGFLKER